MRSLRSFLNFKTLIHQNKCSLYIHEYQAYDLLKKYQEGQPISMVTCYDYTFATEANVATVQLATNAPVGTYTVNFRVVSADGHVVSDTFSYRVVSSTSSAPTPSGSATTSSAAASSDSSPVAGTTDAEEGSGSSAIWVLGLGAIGLVLVAAMIAVVVRGRRDSTD